MQTVNGLVTEAIRTKAISHFIDHTYPVMKATKSSRGHSTNVMNKESSFHLNHAVYPCSIKRSNAFNECYGERANFLVAEARLTVQHFI